MLLVVLQGVEDGGTMPESCQRFLVPAIEVSYICKRYSVTGCITACSTISSCFRAMVLGVADKLVFVRHEGKQDVR